MRFRNILRKVPSNENRKRLGVAPGKAKSTDHRLLGFHGWWDKTHSQKIPSCDSVMSKLMSAVHLRSMKVFRRSTQVYGESYLGYGRRHVFKP
jgi:hypothetical protein